jgi:hypothetical protein
MRFFSVSVHSLHLVVKAFNRIPVKTLWTNYRYRTSIFVSKINKYNWGTGVHLDSSVRWFCQADSFPKDHLPANLSSTT